MDHETVDRRVRKTKKLFRQSLVLLMSQNKLNEITVRELSEQADVNRGTFYLHYRDIFDLLEQIENEMFADFYNVINKHNIAEEFGKPLPTFVEAFQFVAKNADMCKVLLSNNGDMAFVEKLKSIVKSKSYNVWSEYYKATNTKQFEYFFNFIISGCIGILQHWLNTGMQESPDEMAVLAERMVVSGVQSLLTDK
jgi:AcrR family transcriptional regulator